LEVKYSTPKPRTFERDVVQAEATAVMRMRGEEVDAFHQLEHLSKIFGMERDAEKSRSPT